MSNESGSNFSERMCYFFWDMVNVLELSALTPSTSHPTALQYSSFVLSIVSCIIGYAGNLIVIFITGFLMKKKKSTIWFLNLALADFTFLLFHPLHAVSIYKANWSFGPNMCKLYNFLTFVNMYASIFILTALNIDRAMSIAKPIWHMRFVSRMISYSVCALIWVVAAISSVPAVIYSDVFSYGDTSQCILYPEDLTSIAYTATDRNASEDYRNSEREDCDGYNDPEMLPMWIHMTSTATGLVVPLAIIGCVIPLCVILFSNITIALHVKDSPKTSSSRLYRVVVAAVLAFFCTRTPLLIAQIIYLVASYTQQLHLMYKVTLYLPLLSSIAATNAFLNPIVYVLMGKQVRKEVSQFFSETIPQLTS
ncbi:chemerin-like receptor 1 [Engystomops pustulosus]|uniref:chemerin-like receptor 1 n=1 Tax=Engystomops pustulosus TaxID=76066 RepID=UPI003AFAE8B9